MGLAQGGTVIRDGEHLKLQGIAPAGIALAQQVVWRAAPTAMAWELLASVNMRGVATTAPVDTTGASLIVAQLSFWSLSPANFTDSQGNLWVATDYLEQATTELASQMFYCIHPIASTQHTFSTQSLYPAMFVQAFKSSQPIGVDQIVTATSTTLSVTLPSLTPAKANSLLVTGIAANLLPISISHDFAITGSNNLAGGQYFGGAMAYRMQEQASAVAPTWLGGYTGTPFTVATLLNFIPL